MSPSGLRRWAATLASCLLLVACGSDRDGPESQIPLHPQAVVLAIGDSITTGHRLPAEQAWPALVARDTGLEVVNRARNGATSDDVLQGIDGLLREVQPSLVIATVGGNDFLKRQSLADAEANIRELAQRVTDTGARFLLLGLHAQGRDTVHPLYPAAVEGLSGVYLDDTVLPQVYGSRRLRADPFHPNAKGHALIAERVTAWLAIDTY
jgi:acyl-CoA thioesterase I